MVEKCKAAAGFEPAIEDLQSRALATWLCRQNKAGDGGWTRDPHVGNVMLYHWATPA